jgi:plastocyanin
MKRNVIVAFCLAAMALTGCKTSTEEMGNLHKEMKPESFYLPTAEASRIVSVSSNAPSGVNILIQTHRVAVNETGPKETIAKFGEVYSFSPNFFAVHRDEPTTIHFWNLQPDDNHTFMLMDSRAQVLMNILLPPLQELSYTFTFHEEGLFHFVCAMHPAPMNGQILVLPPIRGNR